MQRGFITSQHLKHEKTKILFIYDSTREKSDYC